MISRPPRPSLLKPLKVLVGVALAAVLVSSGLVISAFGALGALGAFLLRRKPALSRAAVR